MPDMGVPDVDLQDWFRTLADHIQASLDEGRAPEPAMPDTRWEWRARFPELAQLLGGWFSQEMPDEFADHDAALADYTAGAHPQLRACLVGEIRELLALDPGDADLAVGLHAMGCEVAPPEGHSVATWLSEVADTIAG